MATTGELSSARDLVIRPVRPADRQRVIELTRDIWEGRDYIPHVFDDWVSDSGSAFQALELDGTVVGVQRLRPYAHGLVWYEGLRVATANRKQGLARAMLRSAIAEAHEQDFREMRLATGNKDAVHLFESEGFVRILDVRWWRGIRVEGGDPARMPDAAEADRLWAAIAGSPGFDLYGGVTADFNGAHDLDAAELSRLAGIGMLRTGPGGRAVAGLRQPWGNNLAASFIAGQGGALRELLQALRFEADADGLDHVTVALPRDHPAGEDLHASGYDLVNDDDSAYVYRLTL